MLLLDHVVVVGVDTLDLEIMRKSVVHISTDALNSTSEFFHHAVHHLLTVEKGEPLAPLKLGHVLVIITRTLDQPCKVHVWEHVLSEVFVEVLLLRHLDPVVAGLVADATRTGVEDDPHVAVHAVVTSVKASIGLVANLDEVIATAKGPERLLPARPLAHDEPQVSLQLHQFLDPSRSRGKDGGVLPPRPDADGDAPLDPLANLPAERHYLLQLE